MLDAETALQQAPTGDSRAKPAAQQNRVVCKSAVVVVVGGGIAAQCLSISDWRNKLAAEAPVLFTKR